METEESEFEWTESDFEDDGINEEDALMKIKANKKPLLGWVGKYKFRDGNLAPMNEPVDEKKKVMYTKMFSSINKFLNQMIQKSTRKSEEVNGYRTISCYICQQLEMEKTWECKHASDLKRHIINSHLTQKKRDGVKREFECEQCPKKYARKFHLNEHMRAAHTDLQNLDIDGLIEADKKQTKCEYCDKTFLNKRQLRDHATVHTKEKPYRCSICGASMTASTSLMNHFKITHNNISKNKLKNDCRFCGEPFKRFEDCEHHVIEEHGDELVWLVKERDEKIHDHYNIIRLIKEESKEKALKVEIKDQLCSLCGIAYKDSRSLRKHLLQKHQISGGNVDKCRFCNEQFSSAVPLQMHIVTEHQDRLDWMKPLLEDRRKLVNKIIENPEATFRELYGFNQKRSQTSIEDFSESKKKKKETSPQDFHESKKKKKKETSPQELHGSNQNRVEPSPQELHGSNQNLVEPLPQELHGSNHNRVEPLPQVFVYDADVKSEVKSEILSEKDVTELDDILENKSGLESQIVVDKEEVEFGMENGWYHDMFKHCEMIKESENIPVEDCPTSEYVNEYEGIAAQNFVEYITDEKLEMENDSPLNESFSSDVSGFIPVRSFNGNSDSRTAPKQRIELEEKHKKDSDDNLKVGDGSRKSKKKKKVKHDEFDHSKSVAENGSCSKENENKKLKNYKEKESNHFEDEGFNSNETINLSASPKKKKKHKNKEKDRSDTLVVDDNKNIDNSEKSINKKRKHEGVDLLESIGNDEPFPKEKKNKKLKKDKEKEEKIEDEGINTQEKADHFTSPKKKKKHKNKGNDESEFTNKNWNIEENQNGAGKHKKKKHRKLENADNYESVADHDSCLKEKKSKKDRKDKDKEKNVLSNFEDERFNSNDFTGDQVSIKNKKKHKKKDKEKEKLETLAVDESAEPESQQDCSVKSKKKKKRKQEEEPSELCFGDGSHMKEKKHKKHKKNRDKCDNPE